MTRGSFLCLDDLTLSRRTWSHWNGILLRQIMMLFAHTAEDGLLRALFDGTSTLLGSMSNTSSSLDGDLGAALGFALLASRPVGTAESSLLDMLGTPWVFALLSLGTMRNAKTALHDTVLAVFNSALPTNTLAGSTRSELARSVNLFLRRGARRNWSCFCFQTVRIQSSWRSTSVSLEVAKERSVRVVHFHHFQSIQERYRG